jgi:hypothetical protein
VDQTSYIESLLYAPGEIYYKFNNPALPQSDKSQFFEYEDGKLEAAPDIDKDDFYTKTYPRFVRSPSGTSYFWADARDGKNTLFLGGDNPSEGKEIASLSEFTSYGWFTEDYLLVSKKDSELYIMGKDKDATPLKITDYHKPAFNSNSYGGGY